MSKLKNFISESKQEFTRINWPTRQEATKMVFVVILISVIVAVFLGAVDFVFVTLIKKILS